MRVSSVCAAALLSALAVADMGFTPVGSLVKVKRHIEGKHCDWTGRACPTCDLSGGGYNQKPCSDAGGDCDSLCQSGSVGVNGGFTCYICDMSGTPSVCLQNGYDDSCAGTG
jgi:hypothetical protein